MQPKGYKSAFKVANYTKTGIIPKLGNRSGRHPPTNRKKNKHRLFQKHPGVLRMRMDLGLLKPYKLGEKKERPPLQATSPKQLNQNKTK